MKAFKKTILTILIFYTCFHYNHGASLSTDPELWSNTISASIQKLGIYEVPIEDGVVKLSTQVNVSSENRGIAFSLLLFCYGPFVWLFLRFVPHPESIPMYLVIVALGALVDHMLSGGLVLDLIIEIVKLIIQSHKENEKDPLKIHLPRGNHDAILAINGIGAEFEAILEILEDRKKLSVELDETILDRIQTLVNSVRTHELVQHGIHDYLECTNYIIVSSNLVTFSSIQNRILRAEYLQMTDSEFGIRFVEYAKIIQDFNINIDEFLEFKEQINATIPTGLFAVKGVNIKKFYYQAMRLIQNLRTNLIQVQKRIEESVEPEESKTIIT